MGAAGTEGDPETGGAAGAVAVMAGIGTGGGVMMTCSAFCGAGIVWATTVPGISIMPICEKGITAEYVT